MINTIRGWLLLHVLVFGVQTSLAETVERTHAMGDRLVFIHLNDLHANLTPHRDLVRDSNENPMTRSRVKLRGGLARTATLIRQIKENEPYSILMNIGDTYHGGAEALFSRGNAIIAPVDALGIDIGVPGNWDFAYGPIVTRLRYAPESAQLSRLVNSLIFREPVLSPSYPLLGGNVVRSLPIIDGNKPLLPATHLMNRGGHRIGFIGITSDIIPRMSSMLAVGFEFLQGEDAYRNYVNTHAQALREQGADIIVVMSELGLHKDRQLANSIEPGVDIVFSAHTHEITATPLTSNSGALVVEAGNDGLLGKMVVTFTPDGSKHFEWEILEVDSAVLPDPAVLALVNAARAPFLTENPDINYPMPGSDVRLSQSINTAIGTVPSELHRRHALENPFNQALSDSLREYYGTDIAITPGFRFDAVLSAGDTMTVEDSYRYLPVPPVLATGVITGKALKELIEFELVRVFSPNAFDHSGGWLMGLSGLELSLNLKADNGHMISSMRRTADGTEIEDDDELSTISCLRPFDDSDALCGNRGFKDIEPLESPWGGQWTARDFLVWQLEHGTLVTDYEHHITETSGSQFWPEADYIQPLRQQPDLNSP